MTERRNSAYTMAPVEEEQLGEQVLDDIEAIIKQKEISLQLGIVVEKRKSKHPWGDWIWKPIAVLPGAQQIDEWITLAESDDVATYHVGTLPLTLHRKETEALKMNLEGGDPHLYVILRDNEEPDGQPVEAHMVTASSYDAQDYLDTAEEIIEKVPMPVAVLEWIRAFVEEHHKEEVFKKRRRDKLNVEEHKFGKEPIFDSSNSTRH